MTKIVSRKCEACHMPFDVPEGSLYKFCRRPECRSRRMVANREVGAEALRERARLNDLRHDDRLRGMWPEVEEVLHAAADMDVPHRAELARCVRAAGRAEGAKPLRVALLMLSATALRWAGSLPRPDDQLNSKVDKALDKGEIYHERAQ